MHLGRRLISMLCILHRLEHAGGDERRALWKQQPADEQVSLRTANPIGCGECAFTRLSRVSRRSWVGIVNIFMRSADMHEHVKRVLVITNHFACAVRGMSQRHTNTVGKLLTSRV